jgi:hypothetical protein
MERFIRLKAEGLPHTMGVYPWKGELLVNPGYLSHILYLMMLILILTGWFSDKIEQRYRSWAWAFILAWPVLNLLSISYFEAFVVQASYLLIWLGAVFLWVKIPPEHQMSALTMGILLGSIVYLLKEMMRMDPVLIWLGEEMNILLILISIVIFSFSALKARLFAMTFGLCLGELLYVLSNVHFYVSSPILGDSSFQDLWWISATVTVFLHYSLLLVRSKVMGVIMTRRKVGSE